MTIYTGIFYILSASVLLTTLLAVMRRSLVHAAVYLVMSFVGSAMLFYLLGAPLLAVLDVIIYGGGIMVLFLFIIMMLPAENPLARRFPIGRMLPAAIFGVVYLAVGTVMVTENENSRVALQAVMTKPDLFGHYLFEKYWLAVEIVSLLLLIVLVGAVHLGKISQRKQPPLESEIV